MDVVFRIVALAAVYCFGSELVSALYTYYLFGCVVFWAFVYFELVCLLISLRTWAPEFELLSKYRNISKQSESSSSYDRN